MKPIWATIATLLALIGFCGIRYPHFLTAAVFVDLVRDNAILGIAAVGMTFAIQSGGIDLSVGAVVGFTSIVIAKLTSNLHLTGIAAGAIALVLGALFGCLQGWFIARFRLPPFLVTLAGMFLARGAAFVISMESISIEDRPLVWMASQTYFLPFLLLLLFGTAIYFSLCVPAGRYVFAVGGSRESSRLMGVPVARVEVMVYAISGFCSALAGVATTIYTSAGNSTAGTLLELDAIAATVIGGTLLTGGVGSLLGTFFGVMILGVIQTAITFEGTLNSWWSKIVTGILLLVFILIQKGMPEARRSGSVN